MVKPHGISNANAFKALSDSLSGSGVLRAREVTPGNRIFDVNQPVAQLQKSSVLVVGAGRLVIAKGANYIPAYTLGIGASIGSGYTVPSDGIYQVDAIVSVSGVAIETYGGTVLVNSVAASGTQSFADSDARGAAAIKINGIVHAYTGQVINVGVKSLHGDLTTIGSEDLVHAPAANIRIIKLGSDELTNTGS
jgi:hypothetical protein